MKRKVVVGQSGITAGQMQDFWRMVDDGTLDGTVLHHVLTNIAKLREEAYSGDFVTEVRALKILGERRFLSATRIVPAWNGLIKERRTDHNLPLLEVPANLVIRYTEETLRSVALAVDPAWYLVYDPGFSLRDNRAVLGTDIYHQPCHYRGNDWWLSQKEDNWAVERGEPAYHLVRMEGLFVCDEPQKNWDWQEEQIRQMGEEFYRAPNRVMANAVISCFLLNGERHLETYYHWGPVLDSYGCFVVVGRFDLRGFDVGPWPRRARWDGGLRVCLARKFDA